MQFQGNSCFMVVLKGQTPDTSGYEYNFDFGLFLLLKTSIKRTPD